jgi:hypothetical protein
MPNSTQHISRTCDLFHIFSVGSRFLYVVLLRCASPTPSPNSLLEQVVKMREQTLAEDHPDRLASQQVLATVYWDVPTPLSPPRDFGGLFTTSGCGYTVPQHSKNSIWQNCHNRAAAALYSRRGSASKTLPRASS